MDFLNLLELERMLVTENFHSSSCFFKVTSRSRISYVIEVIYEQLGIADDVTPFGGPVLPLFFQS